MLNPAMLESNVERLFEIGSLAGAGAAGAVMAVVVVGGSLLLVLPTALVIGLIAFGVTHQRGEGHS